MASQARSLVMPTKTLRANRILSVNTQDVHRRKVEIKRHVQKPMHAADGPPSSYSLYASRWAQLGMLSLLALVSDWACFATAAVPHQFIAATGHDPAQLIDVFLAFNVASCFMYTDISRVLGLRTSTAAAAALMAVGCTLRCGSPVDPSLPSYATLVIGTALVGIAQPFFQCAPPLLSATWFASSERSLATATALNANQLGIAAAFIVGGAAVSDPETLKGYLETIAAASFVGLGLTLFFFKDKPPTPPTASAAAKLCDVPHVGDAITYPRAMLHLVSKTPGFVPALVAFVGSICVTNLVSAFAGDELERAGCGEAIAGVGAAFQVAIVLGGIGLGTLVDKTRAYKSVTLACVTTALALLAILGVAQGYDAQLPPRLVVSSVLALGAVAGPIQPIAAELAVEVSHPFDENAVEATQQLVGNLASAMLLPAYQAAREFDLEVEPTDMHPHHFGIVDHLHDGGRGLVLPEPALIFGRHLHAADVRGDTLLLLALLGVTFVVLAKSNFILNRANFDDTGEGTQSF